MSRRVLLVVIAAAVGFAVLISLGSWQLQRLSWKQGILAEIDAALQGEPVAVPGQPSENEDKYLPVRTSGTLLGPEVHVLASLKGQGAVYRVISPLETDDGRRIMLDRGTVPAEKKEAARDFGQVEVLGNLHWPDEIDGFTPEPDRSANIWFARDISAMAEVLNTEPVLVVVREMTGLNDIARPLPVDTAGIPNDHLQYAITWFSLAAIWAVMTAVLVRRIRRVEQQQN